MSEQENIKIARKLFDDLNSHNPDASDSILASDMRVTATGSPGPMTRDQGKMYNRQFLDAFPDLHFDLKDIIAQGDKVAVSWIARGTHQAPLSTLTGDTIPPTNRSATVNGCTITEIRNNMVTRQDVYWDQISLFSQLGLVTAENLLSKARR